MFLISITRENTDRTLIMDRNKDVIKRQHRFITAVNLKRLFKCTNVLAT